MAQIEKGDTEVGLQGYFVSRVGEDIEANGAGSIQLSWGKYFTDRLLIGIAPTMTFFTTQDEHGDPMVKTDYAGSVFFNLNFNTTSKLIPYLTGQFFQFTFDIPEDQEFTDYSYATVGLGFKNFFNEYAAFDTIITYGFSLAKESRGGVITIRSGLSFIF
jgi:hypothetical protein